MSLRRDSAEQKATSSYLPMRRENGGDSYAPLAIQLREFAPHSFDFRRVVDHDVQIVGMVSGVILVVGLCRIEHVELLEFGNDRPAKGAAFVQLLDVSLSDLLLLGACKEYRGTILSSDIRALPVELRRVVCGEENLQQLS